MHYRRLGRTNLQVSAIALGTVELGLDYGIPSGDHTRPSEAAAGALLAQALDAGINLIDTARAYGESEAIIGRALHARRNDYILATKVAPPPEENASATRRAIAESVEESLRQLRTETIDILKIHSASVEDIRRGVAVEAIQELQRAGRVRYIGVTTYSAEASLAAIADGRYDCIQIAYNLLDRRPEAQVLPAAQAADVGIVVRSVLLKGALTHRAAHLPPALAELRAAAERLASIAAHDGRSLPALAYRYVLDHPAVTSALIGTARPEELSQAIGFLEQPPIPESLREMFRSVAIDDQRQLNPSTWPI
jgi:aryl-alcohol dehydrogenase-like predicted oxidoreductase